MSSSTSASGAVICDACLSIPPVVDQTGYTPKGEDITISTSYEKGSEMPCYIVGDGPKAIVLIYDIFGDHPNARQICDKFAEAGYTSIMPDFFRGKPWPNVMPIDREKLLPWIAEENKHVDDDVAAVLEYLERVKSCSMFGTVGFCWGGKMSVLQGGKSGKFKVVASAHPSFLTVDDAKALTSPVLLLPSKDEPDLSDFMAAAKVGFPTSNLVLFPDMHHGWCTARGDWTVEEQRIKAWEAIQLFIQFFNDHLK